MRNPWLLLHERVFHVHPDDAHRVEAHNRKVKSETRIQRSLPALPYTGDPRTARVILLAKNPSFSSQDEVDGDRLPDFLEENIKSLVFESRYPFFYLDPAFTDTNGARWWNQVLGELLTACEERGCDRKELSGRIACIQWHPYRSERTFDPKEPFATQAYATYLAAEAARRGATFVILGGAASERLWRGEVPELPTDCIRPKSPQSPSLTRANLGPETFEQLAQKLSAPDA